MRKVPPRRVFPSPGSLRAYLCLGALADAVAPLVLRRRQRLGKEEPSRILERLGHPGSKRPEGPLLWFHAASVGESLSLLSLIEQICATRPDVNMMVTTGTRTSAELLARRLPKGVLHQFAPVDARRAVTRFLDHWRPDLAVWTESELWPRLIVETAARGVSMLLINARISSNSAENWRRAPRMIKALLTRFDAILAQDDDTAQVLLGFGVAADKVLVTGTLKREAVALPCDAAELARLRTQIGTRPLWLAASTHLGEETIIARAHSRLLADLPDLLLILVPRHPDRAAEVAAELEAQGLSCARRQAGDIPSAVTQVYLADTLGEMGLWYRLAPVAFIGGSLVPIGGHNPFEPAALGAAMIVGPHVRNFAGIFAELKRAHGVIGVDDAATLSAAVAALLQRDQAATQANLAREACASVSGATERALEAILSRLPLGKVSP